MTDPDTDTKSNGAENEKSALDHSVSVPVDELDESKAQLIRSNGGAGDHPEVVIVDGTDRSDHVSFNGLGKDEVLQYANDPFWVRLRWVLFILFWVGWFAMLVTAIVIIVVAPRCPPRPDMKWYQTETVYQAYSKSFKDSDKDGFGDFKGLKDKFDHITDDVGAKAVYLNSIFKTADDLDYTNPEKDLAIVDHKELDSKFETTISKFKSWIKDLRKKGQNVILDFIPNQTSKMHEWFKKSVNKDKDYKDYYIWAPNTGGKVPNDWKNINGESAWTLDSTRNEWYYHSHSKDLPDLNLNNEAVRQEMKDIMKFWFKAGVGGFNIMDLEYLVEDPDLTSDNTNRSATFTFLEELRDIADDFSDKPGRERFLFGNVENVDQMYWKGEKEKRLHLVVPTMPLGKGVDASALSDWIGKMPDERKEWLGLQLGNQDTSRIGSRNSSEQSSQKFVKIAHALQLLLPGTPFNYYGDEFGQKNGDLQKMSGKFNPMNARTPMQWNNRKNAGFSDTDNGTWVDVGPGYKSDNLMVSQAHFNEDDSVMRSQKKLIDLRARESFQWGKTKACAANKDVLLFNRQAEGFPYFLVLINMGKNDYSPHLPSLACVDSKEKGTVVFHSRNEGVGDTMEDGKIEFEHAIKLEPGDVIVIEF